MPRVPTLNRAVQRLLRVSTGKLVKFKARKRRKRPMAAYYKRTYTGVRTPSQMRRYGEYRYRARLRRARGARKRRVAARRYAYAFAGGLSTTRRRYVRRRIMGARRRSGRRRAAYRGLNFLLMSRRPRRRRAG